MANRAVVKPRKQCKIGDTISIDSCLEETHNLESEVTDHEVEDGFNISDHVRPKPDMVTLRCFVSNTPLSPEQMQQANRDGSNGSDQSNQIRAIDGRGNDTYQNLLKLRGKLVQVVTTLKTYKSSDTEGMIIQSLSIPRTGKNFDGLEFSVTFKQVRIVKNKQTRDVQSKDSRVGGKKKTGSQPTKESTGPEKNKSLAAASADGLAKSDNGIFSAIGKFAGGIK